MEGREGSGGVDRRRFIKGAATVAWATPLVLTLGATSARAQPSPTQCVPMTGRPEFCPCTASSQCADGCCCGPPVGGGACTSQDSCEENTPGGCL
jgi:hypothetical protein